MPLQKVYAFSQHVGALCVTQGTDVYKRGANLGANPQELLKMIDGKVVPTDGCAGAGTRAEFGREVSGEAGRGDQEGTERESESITAIA
jgi:hypothetical protein